MTNSNESFIDGLNKEIKELQDANLDTIIKDLPEMLQDPCNTLTTEVEKEVFLIGALGIVSGILPNVLAKYAGDWIGPNIFVYILGEYGGGKGGMKWAKALANGIHAAKKEEHKALEIEYQKDILRYKKQLAKYNKSKKDEDPPYHPSKPPILMLFLPVNNSKSGLLQLLMENKNRGILYESEGDSLADTLKQDYGNYSDLLRKVFHHELLDFFRRENNETVDIQKPYLSVVLSSTPDQLKRLISSPENGLYSRFLYYYLKPELQFIDVFNERMGNYSEKFEAYSMVYKMLFDYLENLESPIYFKLSDVQKSKFLEYFRIKKGSITEGIGSSMAGTANRLGIIAFRIMMIFCSIRSYKNQTLSGTIECDDVDFYNALRIVERLETHAIRVYEHLGQEPDKKKMAFDLKNSGVSLREIEKITKINRGTLSKWFKKETATKTTHTK